VTGEFVTAGHLGGYIAGGDPDAWYPQLWDWLVTEHGVRSVLDVGCGDGATINYFAHPLRCVARGIEGTPQDDPHIVQHDYTRGAYPHYESSLFYIGPDLVWCCEFVEHVEEQHVPNFLETFKVAPLVLMTHALPGQPGWHHVNCQDDSYWVGQLATIGYSLDEKLTAEARGMTHGYFAQSGLAFRRDG
jgi:hypothetical protein